MAVVELDQLNNKQVFDNIVLSLNLKLLSHHKELFLAVVQLIGVRFLNRRISKLINTSSA